MKEMLTPLIDLLVQLPSLWVAAAVIVIYLLQNWNRTVGALIGLAMCPVYALWGYETYLHGGKLSLFGVVPLKDSGFYAVIGLLAAYYVYALMDQARIASSKRRLRQSNKKWG